MPYRGTSMAQRNVFGQPLWLKKKVVLKTNTILKSGSPLFIAGPKWGKGRLVMVVALK